MPEAQPQQSPLPPRAPRPEEVPTTVVSQDPAIALAMKKITRILETLPSDSARSRVIRATAILLDIPVG